MKSLDIAILEAKEYTGQVQTEPITLKLLEQVRELCSKSTYLEYTDMHYSLDENNLPLKLAWLDVEGVDYGWVWLDKTREETIKTLKEQVHLRLDKWEENIRYKDYMVIIVKEDDKQAYHFVDEGIHRLDNMFTFSDCEIDY